MYAVGLVGYSAVRIASPTFYALRKSRIPVAVSVCTIVINVIVNLAFVRVMGFRGLALGTSLAAMANGAALVLLLRRHLNGIEGRRLTIATMKVGAASLVMALAAIGAERWMTALAPGRSLGMQVVRLAVEIGSALGALAITAKVLRIREFDEAVAVLTARLTARRASM